MRGDNLPPRGGGLENALPAEQPRTRAWGEGRRPLASGRVPASTGQRTRGPRGPHDGPWLHQQQSHAARVPTKGTFLLAFGTMSGFPPGEGSPRGGPHRHLRSARHASLPGSAGPPGSTCAAGGAVGGGPWGTTPGAQQSWERALCGSYGPGLGSPVPTGDQREGTVTK